MKSCLKLSPPLTPLFNSTNASPIASGSSSPTTGDLQLPHCRKSVSFCEDHDEFFADDWDRTPAPVAPKLSYQEVLELKQIMNSLPRAPQCAMYRPPFSTSVPHLSMPTPPVSSCSSTSFPVSRWASAPSLTPSRWKNRDATHVVDPQILPYLDSVPIQLLPLLPPPSEPATYGSSSQSSQPNAQSNGAATARSEPIKAPSIPMPIFTPPPSLESSTSSSPVTSPAPSSPPTPRRKTNFAFVPLLPVQDEVKLPAPAPVVAPPPMPARKFNMTFVPLLPPDEPQQPQPSTPTLAPPNHIDAIELTPQNETPPEEDIAHSPPHSSYMQLGDVSRSYTSTPSLSSASDTDTESETPSVSSPCPSSPLTIDDDDDALSHYFAITRPSFPPTSDDYHPSDAANSHNPYFPNIPTSSSSASEPSSVALFASAAGTPLTLCDVATHALALVKKTKLEALPSPALQPPSPFSLYPSSQSSLGADDESLLVSGKLDGLLPLAKRAFVARSSALSATGAVKVGCGLGLSPGMSPELTVELMRNAGYYGGGQQQQQRQRRRSLEAHDSFLLAPSISRREFSS